MSRIIYIIVDLYSIVILYHLNSSFNWELTDPNSVYWTIIPIIMGIVSIFSFLGLFFVLINYITHPNYLFMLPFPIQSIIIYNKAGLTIYHREIIIPKYNYNENLLSGALTAISTLILETLGPKAELQHIIAAKFHFFFKPLPYKEGTLAVISYGATRIFKYSLERCVKRIPINLFDLINNSAISPDDYESEIDSVVLKSFPYITQLNPDAQLNSDKSS